MATFTLEKNREYWEDPQTVSLSDSNLHDLEIQFISKFLKPDQIIADIGCGDGYATFEYAKKVRHCYGIERSRFLTGQALRRLGESEQQNITFEEGDILQLSRYEGQFDVVITQRVLINLPSWELQAQAIDNIHRSLKPGGLYVLIETTHDGHDVLNRCRVMVGLKPIPIRWHNHFIDYDVFTKYIDKRFALIERRGFDLYYLLTRVYIQMFAPFAGSGPSAEVDPIFAKSDAAARILFERIGNEIVFTNNPVFGAVQGMALVKCEGA